MKPETRPGPITVWNRKHQLEKVGALRRELEERGVLLPSRGRGL